MGSHEGPTPIETGSERVGYAMVCTVDDHAFVKRYVESIFEKQSRQDWTIPSGRNGCDRRRSAASAGKIYDQVSWRSIR